MYAPIPNPPDMSNFFMLQQSANFIHFWMHGMIIPFIHPENAKGFVFVRTEYSQLYIL
jgi:hypothetical protein